VTTIAYKDGVLASDSRSTEGDDSAKSNCVKIWRIVSKVEPVRGEILLGCSGDEFGAALFKEWMEKGGEPFLHARGVEGGDGDGQTGDDFDALIVHKSGLYNANRLCCLVKTIERFWAHGTGRQGALVAMRLGKSAVDAVRVTAGVDPYTGGKIVSLRLTGKK
jgi:hypothetical protein